MSRCARPVIGAVTFTLTTTSSDCQFDVRRKGDDHRWGPRRSRLGRWAPFSDAGLASRTGPWTAGLEQFDGLEVHEGATGLGERPGSGLTSGELTLSGQRGGVAEEPGSTRRLL
jgi:hypothetical protein